jgi:hypothetical protein
MHGDRRHALSSENARLADARSHVDPWQLARNEDELVADVPVSRQPRAAWRARWNRERPRH